MEYPKIVFDQYANNKTCKLKFARLKTWTRKTFCKKRKELCKY